MEVFMECAIRKWKLEDAWNLSLEKSGFILEGTLRSNAVKNGKILDMKMYAKIK